MSIQTGDSVDEDKDPAPPVMSYGTIQEDDASSFASTNGGSSCNLEDESRPLISTTSARWTVPLSPSHESQERRTKRWLSIYIMYFTMFVASLNFSLVISSMWPYLLQVDYHNATPKFLGWVVASYSIGMLIASPLLGVWADHRPCKESLFATTIVSILFSLLYSYCDAFPAGIAGWVLLLARFVTGLASGVVTVCRSYIAEATYPKERTGAMAAIVSAQALGFVIGPVMGLAFIPLGVHGVSIKAIKFQLSMLTAPGYIAAILGVINLVILFFFREFRLEDRETKKRRAAEEAQKRKELKQKKLRQKTSRLLGFAEDSPRKPYDLIGALAAATIFFVVMSGFSAYETLLSPLTMDEFGWSQKQVVLYNNLLFCGVAVIVMTVVNTIKYVVRFIEERKLLIIGLLIGACGFFVILPMSDKPPEHITISSLINPLVVGSPTSIPMIPMTDSNETLPALGCREPPLMWCSHVPRILLPQVIVSLMFLSFSYSLSSVTCFATFSKVLGPFPQGFMMGFITGAGSLARGLGPMLMGLLYQHYGPLVTFSTMCGFYMITVIFALAFFSKLVSYERYAGIYGPPR